MKVIRSKYRIDRNSLSNVNIQIVHDSLLDSLVSMSLKELAKNVTLEEDNDSRKSYIDYFINIICCTTSEQNRLFIQLNKLKKELEKDSKAYKILKDIFKILEDK